MQIADPIIRTKLRIPRTRPELVERPDLLVRAARGLRGPLTVIAAPAGFGKTTLAAAAVDRCGLPAAWLSLDGGDNSPGTFLAYLTAALQSASSGSGVEAVQLLAASQPVPAEIVLTSLVNDLEQMGRELVLVLDDYHTIHHSDVHAALVFLLEHQPQNLHLLIATRTDPPLPLTRLRARAQIVEIRAAELRFSERETAQFLNEVMGLNLNVEAVSLLEERTEGWIAGLQMAALSMRDRQDTAAFLAGFSGTHRYILDYLIEEVLAGQPPEVQDFLLRTSVLDRLNAALCAALMDEDATAGQAQAAAMLDRLDRNHLFLTPLDDERVWYRYHHLFGDLLRARREQLFPGLGIRLHQRAAAWLESNGYTVEAVNQALAAGDHDRAARLVEQNTSVLLARGELSALMTWITALPVDLRQTRPWLCIHQAYVLLFAGQMGEIPALLEAARQIPAGVTEVQAQAIQGAVTTIAAMAAAMTGRDAEGAALAKQSLAMLPLGDAWNRASAAWALGYSQRSLGNLVEARTAFEEQIRLAKVLGNIWTLVTGMTDLAQVLRTQGHLSEARAILEEALHQAALQGARGLGYIARMEAGLASVLYEQNELDAAAALLADSEIHCLQWPNPNHLAYTHAIQARLQLALGRPDEAQSSIKKAVQVINSMPMSRMVRRIVEVGQVNVPLASGELDADARAVLDRWADELETITGLDEIGEMAVLTRARAWLADKKTDLVQPWMLHVIRSAVPAGRDANAASAFLLCALAAAGKDRPSAQAAIGQALVRAEPGKHIRLFLDEGRAVRPLLAEFVASAQPGELRTYARMLLAQFPDEENGHATGGLPEPLSGREREVLALMAEGASNQEIATRLVVAPGTVKAHTASIYRKLDVPNRTAAVARARQLGLIS